MGMAASLGFVVGPAAAGILGNTAWGPRLPILMAALFAAITTAAIIFFLDEPPRRCPKGPPVPGIVEAGLHQQAKPCCTSPVRGALRAGIGQGPVVLILTATFILFLGFNLFYAGFPIHAAEIYGWSAAELGMFFALLSGFMIVAQGPLLTLASRYSRRSVVFAIGIGFLILAFISFQMRSGTIAYVGAACFAFGNGLSWPTFQARVAEAGGEHQGTVQGAVTSASSLASIVGLVIGGLIYPALGGTTFLVAAGIFIFVLLLTPLWFALPREKTGQT
jgi:MFS family permease